MTDTPPYDGERQLTWSNIVEQTRAGKAAMEQAKAVQDDIFEPSRVLQAELSKQATKFIGEAITDAIDDWPFVELMERPYLAYLHKLAESRTPNDLFMILGDAAEKMRIACAIDDENGDEKFIVSADLFEMLDKHEDCAASQAALIADLEAMIARLKVSYVERFGEAFPA